MQRVQQRITETPNELSRQIDEASPVEMVRILRQVDAQLFAGWEGGQFAGLLDASTTAVVAQLAECVTRVLRVDGGGGGGGGGGKTAVVLSGCGTSGRLAFLCAHDVRHEDVHYLIAGGDAALVMAQEAGEDDPASGRADLEAIVAQGYDHVVLVGITCGLSAPYVAGQLEYALDNPDKCTPCLLGFNPLELARNSRIEGYPWTFREVVERVRAELPQAMFCCPVVGPEAITGSTRMKSGSATKILLDAVFSLARSGEEVTADAAFEALAAYEAEYRATYKDVEPIAELIARGGNALCQGGHIYYIGEGRPGLLGFIDASEQPPTFGASFTDVRGFVVGGWDAFGNREGDLRKGKHSGVAEYYDVSTDAFASVPPLTAADLIIFLGDTPRDVVGDVGDAHVARVRTGGEMSLKWILNAVSTGAHILKGQVYENKMINLRLSNNKLFFRAITIVEQVAHVDNDVATDAVLRAIYQLDAVSDEHRNAPVSAHIKQAASVPRVVPTALLLAAADLNVAQARAELAEQPIVRTLLSKHLSS